MSYSLVYKDSIRATSFWGGREKGQCVCITDCDAEPVAYPDLNKDKPQSVILTVEEVRHLIPALQGWLAERDPIAGREHFFRGTTR